MTAIASPWKRLAANAIDSTLVYGLVCIVVLAAVPLAMKGGWKWFVLIWLLAGPGVRAVFDTVYVASALGATPGKLALRIRVVTPAGGRVSMGRAFLRSVARALSAALFDLPCLVIFLSPLRLCPHDLVADTRVVDDGD